MAFFNVFSKTLGFLIGISLFLFLINILVFYLAKDEQDFIFTEGNEASTNIIVTLNINGPIISNLNNNPLTNIVSYIDPEDINKILIKLEKINPKILIIKINSPGGTVVASSNLERIISQFKKEKGIEVIIHTSEILASGGYWVATTGDQIYASYGSIIGSIGVSGPNWYFYDNPISISNGIFGQSIETRNGIKIFEQNAGKSKDLYNPFREPSKQELIHLQNLVEGIYDEFILKVSKSRKIEISTLKNNIGALIFSSNQAKKNFLIDDVMNYDQLIKKILKDKEFDDYKILEIDAKDNLVKKYLDSFFKTNYDSFCNKINTNFISIIPTFLHNC